MSSSERNHRAGPSRVDHEFLVVRLYRAKYNNDLANYFKRIGVGQVASVAQLGILSNSCAEIVGGVIVEACPAVFYDGGLCSRTYLLKPVGTEDDALQFRIMLQLIHNHSEVAKVRVGDYMAVHAPKRFSSFGVKTFCAGPSGLMWVHPHFSARVSPQTLSTSPVKSTPTNGTAVSQANSPKKDVKTVSIPNPLRPVENYRALMPPPSNWTSSTRMRQPTPSIDSTRDDCRDSRLESNRCPGTGHGCHGNSSSRDSLRECSYHRPINCFSCHRHQCHGCDHCNDSCSSFQEGPSCQRHAQYVPCCPSNNHCHYSGHQRTSCKQPSSSPPCSYHHLHTNQCGSSHLSCRSTSSHCHPSCHSVKPGGQSTGHIYNQSADTASRKPITSEQTSAVLIGGSSERPQWFVSKWVEQSRLQSSQESNQAIFGDNTVVVLSDEDTFTSISQVVPKDISGSQRSPNQLRNELPARDDDSDSGGSDTSKLFLQSNTSLLNLQPSNRAKSEIVTSVKRSVTHDNIMEAPAVRVAKRRKLFVSRDNSWFFDPSKPSGSKKDAEVVSVTKNVGDTEKIHVGDTGNSNVVVDKCSGSEKQKGEDSSNQPGKDSSNQPKVAQDPPAKQDQPNVAPVADLSHVSASLDQTDSDGIISPSQSPLQTKLKYVTNSNSSNVVRASESSTKDADCNISALLMEWDSETGSGGSNHRELEKQEQQKANKSVESLLKDLTGDTITAPQSDNTLTLSDSQSFSKLIEDSTDANQRSNGNVDKQRTAKDALFPERCNVVSQTSDEPDETIDAAKISEMSIEKNIVEMEKCDNYEELVPGDGTTAEERQCPVNSEVDDNLNVSNDVGHSLDMPDLGMEFGDEMSLTMCQIPINIDPPALGSLEESTHVAATPQDEPEDVTNGQKVFQVGAGSLPSEGSEVLKRSGELNAAIIGKHSCQSELNLHLSSASSHSKPSGRSLPIIVSRCITPDSTIRLSPELPNHSASPSSTVFYDAQDDEVATVSHADEEGQMEQKLQLEENESCSSDVMALLEGEVSLRDLTAGLQGEIVDMVPPVTAESSRFNIVKGICRLGCQSQFDYCNVKNQPTMIKSCSRCSHRSHHRCPVCWKKRLKKPVCLMFNFELHVSVAKNVLRLKVYDEEATHFLGVSVKQYLRREFESGDVIRQLKHFSNINLAEDQHSFKGHFYFKIAKINDSPIPVLTNTKINDFRLSVKGSLQGIL